MNTVHNKYFNTTIASLQDFLEKNFVKLGISGHQKNKIIKNIRKFTIDKNTRCIFFVYCNDKINNTKRKKNSHITSEERKVIQVLLNCSFNKIDIAKFLDLNRSSITKEFDKYKYIEIVYSFKSARKHSGHDTIAIYDAEIAQRKSNENRLKSRKKNKLDKYESLRVAVVELIKNGNKGGVRYSPEAISALSKLGKLNNTKSTISATAIYKMVHDRRYGVTINDLPFKRRYFKSQNKHTKPHETPENKKEHSIDIMPIEAKEKTSKFFWEGDSVVGKRDGIHSTLITLVNTYTKFVIIERAKNKTAQSFVNVLNNLETNIEKFKDIIKILLLDNGVEFSDIKGIEQSKSNQKTKRLLVYFAHAYASYERGLNENTNGLIRRDIIKAVSYTHLTLPTKRIV